MATVHQHYYAEKNSPKRIGEILNISIEVDHEERKN